MPDQWDCYYQTTLKCVYGVANGRSHLRLPKLSLSPSLHLQCIQTPTGKRSKLHAQSLVRLTLGTVVREKAKTQTRDTAVSLRLRVLEGLSVSFFEPSFKRKQKRQSQETARVPQRLPGFILTNNTFQKQQSTRVSAAPLTTRVVNFSTHGCEPVFFDERL